MKIRKMVNTDIKQAVELWYQVSVKAHGFIPPEYWEENKKSMQDVYLPNSETYVAVENGKVYGFTAMVDEYLAAIFVLNEKQGQGIGSKLLNHVKEMRKRIELKVFVKNTKSVEYYKKNGFHIISEGIDENTGEKEYTMEWNA